MSLLEIKNLHVEVEGKKILNGLTLTIEKGQVAAIMGPNGSGKSTLAYVLAGKDNYHVTEGDVLLDGESILGMAPDERAAKGVFLAFQYPVEVPGVATMTFLRTALNAQRKHRGEPEFSTPEFMKRVRETSKLLGIDQEMLRRAVNVGFSGGEKKRNEILQMAVLEPRLAVLDETDSGLDIDALKIVADGVNRLRSPQRSMIVITHYQRLLNYIVPDVVHVLAKGRVVKIGRQGTGARARSHRLCAIRRRGGVMNVEVRNMKTAAEQALAAAFAAARATLPGKGAVAALREDAFQRFDARGLPHRRVEEWKYTDLRALMREAKPLAGPAGAKPAGDLASILSGVDADHIAIVNGRYEPAWSNFSGADPGIALAELFKFLADEPDYRLGQVPGGDDPAHWLNTAFMSGGVALRVKRGDGCGQADPYRACVFRRCRRRDVSAHRGDRGAGRAG